MRACARPQVALRLFPLSCLQQVARGSVHAVTRSCLPRCRVEGGGEGEEEETGHGLEPQQSPLCQGEPSGPRLPPSASLLHPGCEVAFSGPRMRRWGLRAAAALTTLLWAQAFPQTDIRISPGEHRGQGDQVDQVDRRTPHKHLGCFYQRGLPDPRRVGCEGQS